LTYAEPAVNASRASSRRSRCSGRSGAATGHVGWEGHTAATSGSVSEKLITGGFREKSRVSASR
jgi:hypothetical protein